MSCQLALWSSSSLPPPTPYFRAERFLTVAPDVLPTSLFAPDNDERCAVREMPWPLLSNFAFLGEVRRFALETCGHGRGLKCMRRPNRLGRVRGCRIRTTCQGWRAYAWTVIHLVNYRRGVASNNGRAREGLKTTLPLFSSACKSAT